MLEMPATLPPKPAAGPAPVAAPMQAGNGSTDFRAQLREVLETTGAAAPSRESGDASTPKFPDQTLTADGAIMPPEAKSVEALAIPTMGLGNSDKADFGALPIWNDINLAPPFEATQEVAGIILQNASILAPEAAVVLAGAGSGPSLTSPQTMVAADSGTATLLSAPQPQSAVMPGTLNQAAMASNAATGTALQNMPGSGVQAETPPMAPAPGQLAAAPFGLTTTQLAQMQQGKIVTQEADAASMAANIAAQQMAAPAILNGSPSNGLARRMPAPPGDGHGEVAKAGSAAALLERALATTGVAAEITALLAAEPTETPWRPAMQEAPQAAAPKPAAETRGDTLPFQAHVALQPEAAAARIEAAAPQAAGRDGPAPPARQLAPVIVSLALGRGDEALTIALDPGELGRVEVSIGQGKEAGQLRIVAERADTLALLQRDQRELDRALNQAGLGDMARSLSFSLASDQGRQQQQGMTQERANRPSTAATGTEDTRPIASPPAPRRSATSLIDIAV
jgi:flagellar hook-length control protein FliK